MTLDEEALLDVCGPCFTRREGAYVDLPREQRAHEARVSSVQVPILGSVKAVGGTFDGFVCVDDYDFVADDLAFDAWRETR